MKDEAIEKYEQVKWHINDRRDILIGAVGGIFIGAGLMALVRKPVVINAVVFAKVEAHD